MNLRSCSRYLCSVRPVSWLYATNDSVEIGCGPFGPTCLRSLRKQKALQIQYKSGYSFGISSICLRFFTGCAAPTAVIFLVPEARSFFKNSALLASLLVFGLSLNVQRRKLTSFLRRPHRPSRETGHVHLPLGKRIHGSREYAEVPAQVRRNRESPGAVRPLRPLRRCR